MPRHPLILPLEDSARAGRRMEGAYRHANVHLDGVESAWRDRAHADGYILAGFGAVGLVLDGAVDLADGTDIPLPVRLEHVLDPDEARKRGAELFLAADLAERLQR
jgi:hypothetical protein